MIVWAITWLNENVLNFVTTFAYKYSEIRMLILHYFMPAGKKSIHQIDSLKLKNALSTLLVHAPRLLNDMVFVLKSLEIIVFIEYKY